MAAEVCGVQDFGLGALGPKVLEGSLGSRVYSFRGYQNNPARMNIVTDTNRVVSGLGLCGYVYLPSLVSYGDRYVSTLKLVFDSEDANAAARAINHDQEQPPPSKALEARTIP